MSDIIGNGTYQILRPRPFPATLSIVVPIFNEEECFGLLRAELEAFMRRFPAGTEIVLVNDGSADRTLEKLVEWAGEDKRVKVIHLSRNFGHQIAATAGYDYATGDAIVLIDADLQDPIDLIPQMVELYCEGYDVVYGQRERRQGESPFKVFSAWVFYRLMRGLVYKRLPVDTGDFRLISRECLNGLQAMRETHRFLRGMVAWVGYPQIGLKFERAPRAGGRTKYPARKMFALAWTAATSFSTLPLQLSVVLGIVIGLFGLEEGVRALLANIFGWYVVPGWSSLMVVTSVIGSSLLISVGIVGQYVGKIYEQSKGRPLYLVSRALNVEADAIGPESGLRETLAK